MPILRVRAWYSIGIREDLGYSVGGRILGAGFRSELEIGPRC